MIGRLGIAAGGVCFAWIMTGSGIAGAQPWQPRDPEPPLDLPAATGLTRADEAAMRLLIEAQIAAMRADDWPGAFALASPDVQAQYGTPAAAPHKQRPAARSQKRKKNLPVFRIDLDQIEPATLHGPCSALVS